MRRQALVSRGWLGFTYWWSSQSLENLSLFQGITVPGATERQENEPIYYPGGRMHAAQGCPWHSALRPALRVPPPSTGMVATLQNDLSRGILQKSGGLGLRQDTWDT